MLCDLLEGKGWGCRFDNHSHHSLNLPPVSMMSSLFTSEQSFTEKLLNNNLLETQPTTVYFESWYWYDTHFAPRDRQWPLAGVCQVLHVDLLALATQKNI